MITKRPSDDSWSKPSSDDWRYANKQLTIIYAANCQVGAKLTLNKNSFI